MRYLIVFVAIVAVIAVGAVLYLNQASKPDQGTLFEHADLKRFDDPYWLQGEAEINLYRASLVKYGQPRETTDVVHILVTEKHDPGLLVKADDWRRSGLLDVMKFNLLVEVQTGVYPYRQMASVFFDRQRGSFVKLVFTSQEWCGTTFKELVNFRGKSGFSFNTYWDGEGSGSLPVDFPPDSVPYDALPVQLRVVRFEPGLEAAFPLLPSQFSSRAEEPRPEMARLHVERQEMLNVPLGTFEAFRLRLESSKGTDVLWFESEFPHRMLKWQTRGGDHFELRESRKSAYWTQNRPEDKPYYQW